MAARESFENNFAGSLDDDDEPLLNFGSPKLVPLDDSDAQKFRPNSSGSRRKECFTSPGYRDFKTHATNRINCRLCSANHKFEPIADDEMEPLGQKQVDVLSVVQGNCHTWDRSQKPIPMGQLQLKIATTLCILFMVGEAVGGYLANSLAIMTDAAHLFSDLATFVVALFAFWIAARPANKRLTFGYHRAVVRLIYFNFEVEGDTMIVVAALGVIMNIILVFVLHGAPNSKHGHSHSSQSMNLRAAFLHVLGDLIQSMGVLLASILIKYDPHYKIADPVCTFIFSIIVLLTTVGIARDALLILLEANPVDINITVVHSQLLKVQAVQSVHDLHIWALSPQVHALMAHLVLEPSANYDKVLEHALHCLHQKPFLSIQHVALQMEKAHDSVDVCTQHAA